MSHLLSYILLLTLFFTQAFAYTRPDQSTAYIVDCPDQSAHVVNPIAASDHLCALSVSNNCATGFAVGAPFVYTKNPGGVNSQMSMNYPSLPFGRIVTSEAVRIVFGAGGAPLMTMQFFVEVDRFSLLEIFNSNGTEPIDPYFAEDPATEFTDAQIKEIEAVEMAVEFMGMSSPAVKRADFYVDTSRKEESGLTPKTNGNRLISPYYTLIITMERGRVVSLDWETSCSGCHFDDKCMPTVGNCGVSPFDCNSETNPTVATSCSIKMYIAWKGTDADGNYLMSAQQTMPNFRMFAISNAYDAAAATGRDMTAGIPSIDITWPTQ